MAEFPNYDGNVPSMSSGSWKADPDFEYSLISNVFKVAENQLEGIFKDYRDMKTFKINEEDLFDFDYWGNDPDVNDAIDDNIGPAVYIIVWMVLALIFTIVGIVWCVCNKCCCCCGKQSNHLDFLVSTDTSSEDDNLRLRLDGYYEQKDKHKMIKQIAVGVFMGLWILGFTFCVFISFASNENMRKAIFELYDDVIIGIDDATTYRTITTNQINAVFVESYEELSDVIDCGAGTGTFDLVTKSKAHSQELRTNTEQFLQAIGHFKNDVVERSAVDDGALGGLGHSLERLRDLLVQKVDPLFNSLLNNATQNEACEVAKETVGNRLRTEATTLINALNEVPIEDVREEIQMAKDDWLDVVGSAVYGSFMGFNVILLIILIGVVVGSVITWVGKGSAKKTGSLFYRFSIAVMFAFGWIMMFAMISQFSLSGVASQVACKAIRDLEDNSTSRAFIRAESEYKVPTYRHLMSSCKRNHGAFDSFNLRQVYPPESIRNISDEFPIILSSARTPDEFFVKEVYAVYASLNSELKVIQSNKSTLISALSEAIYSRTEYLLIAILKNLQELQNGDVLRESAELFATNRQQVDHYEDFVYVQVTENIGKCLPLYNAVNSTVHTFCYKMVAPVATYWWSTQLLLIIFVAVISTALISERVFK